MEPRFERVLPLPSGRQIEIVRPGKLDLFLPRSFVGGRRRKGKKNRGWMDERGIRTTSTGTLDWNFRNKLDSEGRKDEGGRINSLVTKTRDPEREGRGGREGMGRWSQRGRNPATLLYRTIFHPVIILACNAIVRGGRRY